MKGISGKPSGWTRNEARRPSPTGQKRNRDDRRGGPPFARGAIGGADQLLSGRSAFCAGAVGFLGGYERQRLCLSTPYRRSLGRGRARSVDEVLASAFCPPTPRFA